MPSDRRPALDNYLRLPLEFLKDGESFFEVTREIVLLCKGLRGLAKSGAILRISEFFDKIRDAFGVVGAREDETSFAFLDDFRRSILRRGDNGQSGGECFERHVGEGIVERGQEKDIGGGIDMRHGDGGRRIDDDKFGSSPTRAINGAAGNGVPLAFASGSDKKDDVIFFREL